MDKSMIYISFIYGVMSAFGSSYTMFNNNCYRAVYKKDAHIMDWAREFCNLEGGELSKIANMEENQFVSSLHCINLVWIGAYSQDETFKWMIDNSRVSWSPPSIDLSNEKKYIYQTGTGDWGSTDTSNYANGYICEFANCSGVINPAPNLIPQWQTHQDRCFRTFHATVTWDEALSVCNSFGARLAKIDSQATHNFLLSTACNKFPAFFDLKKTFDGAWRWNSTNDSVTWWPPFNTLTRDCLTLESDGEWKEAHCTATNAFICEIQNCDNPGTEMLGWAEYNGSCYLPVNHKNYNFYDAKQDCADAQGFLAKVTSQEDLDFLSILEHDQDWWTGAEFFDGAWRWPDGSTIDWWPVMHDKNDQGDKGCIESRRDKKWDRWPPSPGCSDVRMGYICQIQDCTIEKTTLKASTAIVSTVKPSTQDVISTNGLTTTTIQSSAVASTGKSTTATQAKSEAVTTTDSLASTTKQSTVQAFMGKATIQVAEQATTNSVTTSKPATITTAATAECTSIKQKSSNLSSNEQQLTTEVHVTSEKLAAFGTEAINETSPDQNPESSTHETPTSQTRQKDDTDADTADDVSTIQTTYVYLDSTSREPSVTGNTKMWDKLHQKHQTACRKCKNWHGLKRP